MIGNYRHGHSLVHRLPVGGKLAALAATGTAIFLLTDPRWLVAALIATLLIYRLAGLPLRAAAASIRSAAVILLIIFAAQALLNSWAEALVVVLRFVVLIALANLVTLTTSVTAIMKRVSRWLAPLAYVGASSAKVSLAISLAVRFIPMLTTIGGEIREAQRARGLDRNLLALALPLIVRTLKTADEIAEAIEARGSISVEPKRRGL